MVWNSASTAAAAVSASSSRRSGVNALVRATEAILETSLLTSAVTTPSDHCASVEAPDGAGHEGVQRGLRCRVANVLEFTDETEAAQYRQSRQTMA